MQKLVEVEEARALMNEAREWALWRWLLRKGAVREAADRAVDALAAAEKKVKAGWGEELEAAYRELEAQAALARSARARSSYEKAKAAASGISAEIKSAVAKVHAADVEAETARLDAEATFAEAERQLNTGLAREGTVKAVHSWDLRMKAIRKAEGLLKQSG